MHTFLGMNIVAHPAIPERAPNFKLAPGDYISEEFRREMQAWCDEFFGTHAFAYIVSGKYFMNPKNVAALRIASERLK